MWSMWPAFYSIPDGLTSDAYTGCSVSQSSFCPYFSNSLSNWSSLSSKVRPMWLTTIFECSFVL
ncbi:unnamed protein product [Nippostrongylus brasiliensis]|uniref:Secreted protein n=1 Tax=Nippostrongylus brasiliensis TaxID=27835 RepID=A0A0N4YXE5_NIPBR|nr:unnamed protein product [Nippostrongylus brasiliensis]